MYPLTMQRARQDILVAFPQYDLAANSRKMIATRVLPLYPVDLAHGTYPVLPLKQLLENMPDTGRAAGFELERAPGSAYRQLTQGQTFANYSTTEHGVVGVLDEVTSRRYATHFDYEMHIALKAFHAVLVQREKRAAGQCFSTTVFSGNNTPGGYSQDAGTYMRDGSYNAGGATPWSDWQNSVPRDDVFHAKTKVFRRAGVYPDCMVVSEDTYRDLRMSEQIRQEWIAQGAGSRAYQDMLGVFDHELSQTSHISPAMTAIAEVLDLKEIIVGCAVADANNPNDASFQAVHLWGRSALVFKRTEGTGPQALEQISLGHTMQWTEGPTTQQTVTANNHGLMGVADGLQGWVVEDYGDAETRAQKVRVRHHDEQLIKYKECGELITTV